LEFGPIGDSVVYYKSRFFENFSKGKETKFRKKTLSVEELLIRTVRVQFFRGNSNRCNLMGAGSN